MDDGIAPTQPGCDRAGSPKVANNPASTSRARLIGNPNSLANFAGRKIPWRVTLADGSAFAFAGLCERWDKASDGVPVESCTIITTEANALVAELHDRMPVILPAAAYRPWLGEASASPPELLSMLKPYPANAMSAYRVSTAVNSPKNDGSECVEPVA